MALPSYEYLAQLQAALTGTALAGSMKVHAQSPGSSLEALETLVEKAGKEGGLLLVVMGGALSESIDFLRLHVLDGGHCCRTRVYRRRASRVKQQSAAL